MALGTPVAAAAAYSAASGTTVAPAYPAGILATDEVLLFIGMKPTAVAGGTVTTPTGWTLRDSLTNAGGYAAQGADTGNSNLYVYTWNAPVAGQTGNLTVTIGGNNISWAFIVRVPGGGSYAYGSADGQRTTTPTSPMAIALTNGTPATDFQTGDLAIWAMCIPTDVTTPAQFSAQSITATGATFGTAVELNEPDSSLGNDIGGYSAYASVTAGSSTTAPTVNATLAGTLTNVRGPVVLLRVRDTSQVLTPNLYTNAQTFFAATVARGAVTLTPDLYTNAQTFFAPDVTQTGGAQALTPDLYTNAQTFFTPTVTATRTLTPDLYTNAQTFFSATVTATRTLTPDLYTNAQTFYSPTVTQAGGPQALTPDLYTNAQTFFAATVARGAVTLTPDLYTNAQTFFAATVARGAVTLTPDLYTNAQTFFAATVARGTVTLTPDLYTNAQTFYAATVTQAGGPQAITPDLYTNAQTFYAPAVTSVRTLTPNLYTNAQTFYAATVVLAGATQTLAPQGYVDDGYVDSGYVGPNTFSTQVFFAPTVGRTLQPPLTSNVSQFFPATIESSLYTVTRAQALRLLQIHLLHGLGVPPLVVGPTYRDAGTVQQTVTQAGATVVIATTSAPSLFVGDLGVVIDELAALHGLGETLSVTAASRTAGAISQTIATAGGVTTVTRV